MPASALHSADALMTNVDSALRSVGYDLPSLIKSVDIKTVGLVTGAIILGLLIFDLLSKWFISSSLIDDDHTSSYSSYGRSLAVGAAKIWNQKDDLGLLEGVRGGRSVGSMTKILDSISDAILKWDDSESEPKQQELKTMPRKSKVLFQ